MERKGQTKIKYSFSPFQIILIGFLIAILIGGLLLTLPFFNNKDITVLDAFFTATSAVCVTGHNTVDIVEQFNIYGQIVILLLIEIGGLRIYNYYFCATNISKQKIVAKRKSIDKPIAKYR